MSTEQLTLKKIPPAQIQLSSTQQKYGTQTQPKCLRGGSNKIASSHTLWLEEQIDRQRTTAVQWAQHIGSNHNENVHKIFFIPEMFYRPFDFFAYVIFLKIRGGVLGLLYVWLPQLNAWQHNIQSAHCGTAKRIQERLGIQTSSSFVKI